MTHTDLSTLSRLIATYTDLDLYIATLRAHGAPAATLPAKRRGRPPGSQKISPAVDPIAAPMPRRRGRPPKLAVVA
jgi:hypothetical protein